MGIKQTEYATIGWKKVYSKCHRIAYIAQLLIPAKTKRHRSYKNRVPAVHVLAIFNVIEGGMKGGVWHNKKLGKMMPKNFIAISGHDSSIEYQAGKITKSNSFSMKNIDCAPGIHYFDDIQHALDY